MGGAFFAKENEIEMPEAIFILVAKNCCGLQENSLQITKSAKIKKVLRGSHLQNFVSGQKERRKKWLNGFSKNPLSLWPLGIKMRRSFWWKLYPNDKSFSRNDFETSLAYFLFENPSLLGVRVSALSPISLRLKVTEKAFLIHGTLGWFMILGKIENPNASQLFEILLGLEVQN